MQEWVIEQKNERIKKIIRKKDATELPSGACKELFNTASTHIPKVNYTTTCND